MRRGVLGALEGALGVGLTAVALGIGGAGIAAPSAAAPPAAGPKDAPDPVANYALRVRLDPKTHDLEGKGTLTWRNASRVPQRELYVHLYLNGFRDEGSVFLRTPVSGFRGAGGLRDHGRIDVTRFFVRELGRDLWPSAERADPDEKTDDTDMRVPLPEPVAPGETIHVELAWKAHLPSIKLRTGYAGDFHMVGQWFPKLARLEEDGTWAHFPFHVLAEFYADFGDYDVTIEVPEGEIVAATGERVGEPEPASPERPGWLAHRYVQKGVHDFAFSAWRRFEIRKARAGDVELSCYHPPGFERSADVELEAARAGLDHFGRLYGPYPYATLTLVHPPEGAEEAGGMEYPTLITTGGGLLDPYVGVRTAELVTVHELGHQWFQGMIATNEREHPFLDEGLTSYADGLAMDAIYGPGSVASALGVELSTAAGYRYMSQGAAPRAPIAQPAPAFAGGDVGALVYARTATLLRSLRGAFGAEAMDRAMGTYARRFRFAHPSPEDLLAVVREGLGPRAEGLLRLGLYERGTVNFEIAAIEPLPPGPGGEHRAEVVARRTGALAFPVDVELVDSTGLARRVRWEGNEEELRIPYAGAAPLAHAIVDPARAVLVDESFLDNALTARPRRFAPRVLARSALASGAVLGMLAP